MKKNLALLIILAFSLSTNAQSYFSTVEIKHTFKNNWQLRLRPSASFLTAKRNRTEFLFGKLVGKHWKFFSYTQLDFGNKVYETGTRVDYGDRFLKNEKLTMNIQTRVFFPISKNANFESLLIPDLHYRVHPKLSIGTRNLNLFNPDENKKLKWENSYLGPVAYYNATKNTTLLSYYGSNLLKKNSQLIMMVFLVTL